jgi:hypothetical protein
MKTILFYIAYPIISIVFVSVLTFSDWVIPTHKVEAGGGLGPGATEMTQRLNNALLGAINGTSAATAAATVANLTRETVLDGIAWGIAKQVVSSMIRSLINWVNSGFQGSPAFLQDLKQHLLGILDRTAGNFIQGLGGIGEFICSPFRLDVQAALSVNYARARSNTPSGPTAGLCTLSGIRSNIENFLSGTVENMDQWFQVTSNPQNTPYGAYLEAEARLNVALRNAAGQEVEILRFNSGFLSRRVCEGANGQPSQEGQNCRIVTPGQVIADQLNRALGAPQDALIEADEINELIGALLNQLVMKAMQGMNGLLGLGGNSGYTDPNLTPGGGSFLDDMVRQQGGLGIDGANVCRLIDTQGETEMTMLQIANFVMNPDATTAPGATDGDKERVFNDARRISVTSESNLEILNAFVERLANPDRFATATKTAATIQREVVAQFTQLQQANFFTAADTIRTKRTEWAIVYPGVTNFVARPVLPWGTCLARDLSDGFN